MSVAFSAFLLLLVSGAPMVFVLGIASLIAMVLTTDVPISTIAQRMFGGMNSFTIMAVPFFILAGLVMDAGGLSRRIVNFANALVGWITGSLLHVSIVAATGLAAISGSGTADTAAVTSIMAPELRRRKYDIDFSVAMIAAAGSLAQVIPPSLMMVVIAAISNLSVGAMFLGGIIPGLMTSAALLVVAYIHARRGGPQYRTVERFTVGALFSTFVAALPSLGMPVIIVGGIVGGVFTPTEAAAVAAIYGMLVGVFVHRELKIKSIPPLFVRTVAFAAAVLTIIATASILGWLVANANIPDAFGGWLKQMVDKPWTYLLLINIILMIIGCFMESLAAILILAPVMLPIAISYGINPIHFSVVVVMNFAIGLITPPFGGCLFVASTVAQRTVVQVARKMLWPWVAMTTVLLLVTYIPQLTLYLPTAAGLIK